MRFPRHFLPAALAAAGMVIGGALALRAAQGPPAAAPSQIAAPIVQATPSVHATTGASGSSSHSSDGGGG